MTQETLSKTSTYRVLEVEHLTQHAYRLRTERRDMKFVAGQCANVGMPRAAINREYSLCSGERDPFFDFLIKEVDGGLVSVSLKKLKAGDDVEIHGTYGQFCLQKPEDPARKYLFIGSGTGVAPYMSFVQTYPKLDYKVLHGVRFANEAYGKKAFDPARYITCVSREQGGSFKGRLTDFLRASPVGNDIICYLCGNRGMITEAYNLLRSQGVPGDNLFTEVFF